MQAMNQQIDFNNFLLTACLLQVWDAMKHLDDCCILD